MHKRDVLWGQTLISALVISSAGQGGVSGVIAHREGAGWSQQMPDPIAAGTGDLVVPWVTVGPLWRSSHPATLAWGGEHS